MNLTVQGRCSFPSLIHYAKARVLDTWVFNLFLKKFYPLSMGIKKAVPNVRWNGFFYAYNLLIVNEFRWAMGFQRIA